MQTQKENVKSKGTKQREEIAKTQDVKVTKAGI